MFKDLRNIRARNSRNDRSFRFVFGPIFGNKSRTVFNTNVVRDIGLFLLRFFLRRERFKDRCTIFVSFNVYGFHFRVDIICRLYLLQIFILCVVPMPYVRGSRGGQGGYMG